MCKWLCRQEIHIVALYEGIATNVDSVMQAGIDVVKGGVLDMRILQLSQRSHPWCASVKTSLCAAKQYQAVRSNNGFHTQASSASVSTINNCNQHIPPYIMGTCMKGKK